MCRFCWFNCIRNVWTNSFRYLFTKLKKDHFPNNKNDGRVSFGGLQWCWICEWNAINKRRRPNEINAGMEKKRIEPRSKLLSTPPPCHRMPAQTHTLGGWRERNSFTWKIIIYLSRTEGERERAGECAVIFGIMSERRVCVCVCGGSDISPNAVNTPTSRTFEILRLQRRPKTKYIRLVFGVSGWVTTAATTTKSHIHMLSGQANVWKILNWKMNEKNS